MIDDKTADTYSKIFGPVFLFIVPIELIWIFFHLVKKESAQGPPLDRGGCAFFVCFFFACIWFGIYLCRRGLGWFGGEKRR